jgi:hypothetical protein
VLWSNTADIVWQGANGICIDPAEKAKYAVQIILLSDNTSHKKWQSLEFPKASDRYISLKNSCVIDGQHYIVPLIELKEFGGAIGYGHNLKDAFDMAAEIADSIEGDGIYWNKDAYDKAMEQFEALEKQGIKIL